ncbi:MAG: hypothetical protein ACR2QK_24035, partial [Acidimicrobiales bacterium]
MRRTIKAAAAVSALVAPVAVGWAYTAGASVGEGGPGLAGLFSDETVDEFLVDDFLITRESHDGVVSMSIVGPDGAAVALEDLPADIADKVVFYETEWSPSEESEFATVDGVTCYIGPADMEPYDDFGVVEDINGRFRVLEARVDDGGNVTIAAHEYQPGVLTPEQEESLHN